MFFFDPNRLLWQTGDTRLVTHKWLKTTQENEVVLLMYTHWQTSDWDCRFKNKRWWNIAQKSDTHIVCTHTPM